MKFVRRPDKCANKKCGIKLMSTYVYMRFLSLICRPKNAFSLVYDAVLSWWASSFIRRGILRRVQATDMSWTESPVKLRSYGSMHYTKRTNWQFSLFLSSVHIFTCSSSNKLTTIAHGSNKLLQRFTVSYAIYWNILRLPWCFPTEMPKCRPIQQPYTRIALKHLTISNKVSGVR